MEEEEKKKIVKKITDVLAEDKLNYLEVAEIMEIMLFCALVNFYNCNNKEMSSRNEALKIIDDSMSRLQNILTNTIKTDDKLNNNNSHRGSDG